MMSPTSPVVPSTDGSARVDVTVPLRAEFASIARLVAASLGADAGFTVDDIDDLRLALSEVFSALVEATRTDADPRVTIGFDASGPGLTVTVAAGGEGADGSPSSADQATLDELASSIIRFSVDEFQFEGGAARLVKYGAEQPADQSDS